MTPRQETYAGFSILFDEQTHELRIDDKKIDITRLSDGRYFTPYLPYTAYKTLPELSKAVIDFVPDFHTKQNKN